MVILRNCGFSLLLRDVCLSLDEAFDQYTIRGYDVSYIVFIRPVSFADSDIVEISFRCHFYDPLELRRKHFLRSVVQL